MRWLPFVLLLTACLAPKASDDAGLGAEAGTSSECAAAGGTCLGPGPACLSVISVNISCIVDGTICCTPATAATIAAAAAAASDASSAAATSDATATTSGVAASCDTSCESTCEGDPICIQNCGC